MPSNRGFDLQLEEAGIATVAISTAKDITEAVRMPRAAFLDFSSRIHSRARTT